MTERFLGRVSTDGIHVFELTEDSRLIPQQYYFKQPAGFFSTVDEAAESFKNKNIVFEEVMFDCNPRFWKPVYGQNQFGTQYLSFTEIK